MIPQAASSAIAGAFEILLGRRDGLRRFDLSFEGFWRSFGALLYILPFYAVIVTVEHRLRLADGITDGTARFLAARGVDLLLDWVSMPILLAFLAPRLKLTETYAPYIIVSNWASLPIFAAQALIALPAGLGLIPIDLATLLQFVVLGAMLRYHYVVIGLTIGRTPAFRLALVAANLALSFVLGGLIDQLFGV